MEQIANRELQTAEFLIDEFLKLENPEAVKEYVKRQVKWSITPNSTTSKIIQLADKKLTKYYESLV